MIVALGSLLREASGIIRSGEYSKVDTSADGDILAYSPEGIGLPAVVLGGVGSERAVKATKWAIKYFSPEAIVSFGYCGATRQHESPGDIVLSAGAVNLPGTPFEWDFEDIADSIGPDRTLLVIARNAVENAGLDHHHGMIVTISHITKTAGMKRWLGNSIGAAAVDSKNYAVASVASANGIPWISALSILDARDIDVPISRAGEGTGPREGELFSYARHLSTDPLDLPDVLRIVRASFKATSSLTRFMDSFMQARAAVTGVDYASLS
ncbi:MAG: hypothetical protein O3B95_01360 [Chloroflexi bacterium]|nr:hypothetical protein [Chloroflexota bacterium]